MNALAGPVPSHDTDGNHQRPGVAQRLTQILDVFASGPETILLEDVIRITELPRSTAFRMLTQLVELGWLVHAAPGYRLGVRSLQLGSGGFQGYDLLRTAAATPLSKMHIQTGAVAHLAVLDGPTVRYLDKIGGPFTETVPSHIGKRLPVQASILGVALLASLPPERVDVLVPHTAERSPLWEDASLHGTLHRVRQRRGLAFVPASQSPLNIGVVAAVIPVENDVVAAIGVAGVGLERLDRAIQSVIGAAQETAQGLAHHSATLVGA